ncbi:Legumin B [Hibiscus syriacus]|uniref:Legumin B n=2 Tax=Hibiscus syriacus TaxID=106335 RepID=A0A6A2XZ39_HIBSY|nr:Legumin B [Hibiscus syriacus]
MVTNHQQQQQRRLSRQSECQLQNLNALQPKHRFRSEAGETEFWDQNEQQFQCAGVAFLRHKIQRRGLLLPSFTNAPMLMYIVQGEGIQGAVFPGCAETFQSPSQEHRQQRSSPDQHQKIRRFKEGDVIALPAGISNWIYNNGQSQLVLVALVDVANSHNQLDVNFRKFFLAGNPQEGLVRGGQRQDRSQWQSKSYRRQHEEEQEEEEEERRESDGNNLLSGFDKNLLAEVFEIDTRLARKLQNERDNRGAIVRVEHEIQTPETAEEEQRQQGSEEEEEAKEEEERSEEEREERRPRRSRGERESRNGLEETFCTMRLKHRTDSSFADIFNPRGGRITTVNGFNLPILQWLQLSAERGVLYNNALYAPHWNINAHSIVYITRGNGRIQIVSENGEAIFDDQVQEGQVITIPQNHAVLKKAGRQGFEWIAFKTNANAQISQLAGRVSVMRGLPVDVLANSFGISREEASRLKQNRQEVSVFSPRRGPQQ